MAVILCGKHGKQYGVFCSSYLEDRIRSGGQVERKLSVLKLELLGSPGFFWVDEQFLNEHHLSATSNLGCVYVADEDEALQIYADLVPVCVRCYEEYLASHGLKRAEHSVKCS